MAITPWYVGQLAPVLTIQLVPDSGQFNIAGLTTANFSLTVHNSDSGVDTAGAGTFANLQPAATSGYAPASIQYQLAAADVATSGNYHLFVNAQLPNGLMVFDLGVWQVLVK